MKFIFSESEEIAKRNRRNGIKQNFTISKSNLKEKKIIKPKKKQIKKYTHCRECGELLTNWKSKVWGFCPICESK